MTSVVWGPESVPVRTNKHSDVICPQTETLWALLHEARAKGFDGINKTAGSLNNVRQQFKQAHRQVTNETDADSVR